MAKSASNLSATAQQPFSEHQSSDASRQLDELRAEITRLSALVSDKGGDAYGEAANGARAVGAFVAGRGRSMAATAKEHPAATVSVFALIGAIGFALGFMIAAAVEARQPWYRRYFDRF